VAVPLDVAKFTSVPKARLPVRLTETVTFVGTLPAGSATV
jgi:hypothetical protein